MTQFSMWWDCDRLTGDRPTYYGEDLYWDFSRFSLPYADVGGVVRPSRNTLDVVANSPATGSILLKSGSAFVRGVQYTNDADVSITPDANSSGSTRIDLLVLRADYPFGQVRPYLIKGVPGAGVPSRVVTGPPAGVYDEILAEITLVNGFAVINNADIKKQHTWLMPDMLVLPAINTSGTVLNIGNLVIRDTSGSGGLNKVTLSTSLGDNQVFGIAGQRILASGGTGQIIQRGIVPVICNESVVVGDRLEQSTTSGQARSQRSYNNRPAFGVVVQANSGAGTPCLAYVDFRPTHREGIGVYFEAVGSVNQNITSSVITKANFNTENADYTGDYNNATYVFTAPRSEVIHFDIHLTVGATSVGTCQAYLYKNGAIFRSSLENDLPGGLRHTHMISCTTPVVAGDTFDVRGAASGATAGFYFTNGESSFSAFAL